MANSMKKRNSVRTWGVHQLFRSPERSNVTLMKPAYRSMFHILLFAFSLSSVASPAVACIENQGIRPGQESEIDSVHIKHMMRHLDSAPQDEAPAIADCSCCDECASMCPSAGINPVAITSQIFIPAFSDSRQIHVMPDLVHDCPSPNPLLRPPIPNS